MKTLPGENPKATFITAGQIILTVCLALLFVLGLSCKRTRDITDVILGDEKSSFFLNVQEYPENDKTLPIGIFDSGTGGLAVLNQIIEFDQFDNFSRSFHEAGDGHPDFDRESFIYLADLANMPYGGYAIESNIELLVEHIIKNVQFLMGNRYYRAADSPQYQADKLPVKAIVIASNTATAYGMEAIRNFLKRAEIDLPLIGVIDAGAKGALDYIAANEDGSIAVLATAGTVKSEAYIRAIESWKKKLGHKGEVMIFQQAGVGIAEAIDERSDFIDRNASAPREGYRGPTETRSDELRIDLSLWDRYGFDMEGNSMLFENGPKNPVNLQINSVENYIAFHLVYLMEKIRKTEGAKPLRVVILGCTHYPFFREAFQNQLNRLRNHQEDGQYIYRALMAGEIKIVDPAIVVARELYDLLTSRELYNDVGNGLENSEFYVSVPNLLNENIRLGADGAFTHDYKYGRRAGDIQKYVKCVPFSRKTIPGYILDRLSIQIPTVFEFIVRFNRENPKTTFLLEDERI
ncbi:MAG TPA: hypothetical protein VLH61_04030 [Bacteroidales bacterium]|nr:hypothetical protein [Bacteroidales bacterium]